MLIEAKIEHQCRNCEYVACAVAELLARARMRGETVSEAEIDEYVSDVAYDCPGRVEQSDESEVIDLRDASRMPTYCGIQTEILFLGDSTKQ